MWEPTDDETIVRYLLGQLPEQDRDAFEDRYCHDDVLHGDFVHSEPRPEPPPAPLPTAAVGNPDTLQSLLNSIKQDLKDAAQI